MHIVGMCILRYCGYVYFEKRAGPTGVYIAGGVYIRVVDSRVGRL